MKLFVALTAGFTVAFVSLGLAIAHMLPPVPPPF